MVDENNNPDGEDTDEAEYLVSDRDRGILTSHDREYLLGEKELNGQDERNARYRIRQRAIQAFHDMKLISRSADSDDQRQIASELDDHEIKGGIELAYSLIVADLDVTDTLNELERMVTDAVGLHMRNESRDEFGIYVPDVSVNIDAEHKQVRPEVDIPSVSEIRDGEASEEFKQALSSAREEDGPISLVVRDSRLDEDD